MSEISIQNTAVNLDGLLEVLGQNLYSDSDVAIRELIQNAVDACHRHRLEDPGFHDYSIRLKCDPIANKLIIEDNGSGLTLEEVTQFLATIDLDIAVYCAMKQAQKMSSAISVWDS